MYIRLHGVIFQKTISVIVSFICSKVTQTTSCFMPEYSMYLLDGTGLQKISGLTEGCISRPEQTEGCTSRPEQTS